MHFLFLLFSLLFHFGTAFPDTASTFFGASRGKNGEIPTGQQVSRRGYHVTDSGTIVYSDYTVTPFRSGVFAVESVDAVASGIYPAGSMLFVEDGGEDSTYRVNEDGLSVTPVPWTLLFSSGDIRVTTFANVTEARDHAAKRNIEFPLTVGPTAGSVTLADLDFSNTALGTSSWAFHARCAECFLKMSVGFDLHVIIDHPWYSVVPVLDYFRFSVTSSSSVKFNATIDLDSSLKLTLFTYPLPGLQSPEVPVCIPGLPVCVTLGTGLSLNADMLASASVSYADVGFLRDATDTHTIEFSSRWNHAVPRITHTTERGPSNGMLSPRIGGRGVKSGYAIPRHLARLGIGPHLTMKLFGALFPIKLFLFGEVGMMTTNQPASCPQGVETMPIWSVSAYLEVQLMEVQVFGVSVGIRIRGGIPFAWNGTIVPPQPLREVARCTSWEEIDRIAEGVGIPTPSDLFPTFNVDDALSTLEPPPATCVTSSAVDARVACEECLRHSGCGYCTDGSGRCSTECPVVGSCATANLPDSLVIDTTMPDTVTQGTTVDMRWHFVAHQYDRERDGWVRFVMRNVETAESYCGAGLPCTVDAPRPGPEFFYPLTFSVDGGTPPDGTYVIVAYTEKNLLLAAQTNSFSWKATSVTPAVPMTSAPDCSTPCGDDGVYPWLPAPRNGAIDPLPCNRFPCPLTPLTITSPNPWSPLRPTDDIVISWVGGQERDRFIIEYLAPDCSAFKLLGVTEESQFIWHPPFHEFYHPDFTGSVALTRFRVSLESAPAEYAAISVVPVAIPVIVSSKEWQVSLHDASGSSAGLLVQQSAGTASLWGYAVDNVWGPLDLVEGRIHEDAAGTLATGYPQGVRLSITADTNAAYAVLQPAGAGSASADVDSIVVEVPPRCFEPTVDCVDLELDLPCALFPVPAALIGVVPTSLGKTWLCTESAYESRPAFDLTADATNDYCVDDVEAIRWLPIAAQGSTKTRNEAFRADDSDIPSSLSTTAVAAIASSITAICCGLLCCGAVGLVVTARRRAARAAQLQAQAHAASADGRTRRHTRTGSGRVHRHDSHSHVQRH
jgi:hypothetical protein